MKNRREELLEAINADVPKGVDWQAGARSYLLAMFQKNGRAAIERYSLSKPLGLIPPAAEKAAIDENINYLRNFTETVALLRLRGGARILDVACGGGWFSHWLLRMGYSTLGIDIAGDFIDLARRRIGEDALLNLSSSALDTAFNAHDIEATPLPQSMAASFDAAVLESCLHHFLDPISALTHIAHALKDDGLIVIIEGENRTGSIKEEYMSVMRDLDTLERPYKREHLVEALALSGLPEVEFVAPVPGWMSVRDPLHPHLTEHHRNIAGAMNLCVAGKHGDALRRIFPWRV